MWGPLPSAGTLVCAGRWPAYLLVVVTAVTAITKSQESEKITGFGQKVLVVYILICSNTSTEEIVVTIVTTVIKFQDFDTNYW